MSPTRLLRNLAFRSMVSTYVCLILVPTFSFAGTAISVFGVLPNLTESPNQPSASFTLDNGTPIVFNTVLPDQLLTIHQVPIFQSFNLTLDHHQLEIEAHDNSATLWLDFFMYEQPANATTTSGSAGPTSASHNVKSGTIAGGVVGGIVGALFGVAFLIWLWRKRERRIQPYGPYLPLDNFSPFVMADPATGSALTAGSSTSQLSQSSVYQPIRKVRPSPLQSLTTDPRPQPDVAHSQADAPDNDARPPPYHAEGS